MKVWRAHFTDADQGRMYSWHTSKRSAKAALAKFKRILVSSGPEGAELIDVPTTRKALVRWLNVNLDLDNG